MKLTLSSETLRVLSGSEMDAVQGGRNHRNTVDAYTCNGSVGIACTAINPVYTQDQAYTCNGSIGIACTLDCLK